MNFLADASSAELSGAAPYLLKGLSARLNSGDVRDNRNSEMVGPFLTDRRRDLPSHCRHAEDGADAAKYKRNDASSGESRS